MACEYTSISTYLMSKSKIVERIKAIDELIDLMVLTLADHIGGAGATISEYQLDDGQVKLKTGYRSINEVQNGLKGLETMREMYLNRFNGRGVVLRDIKTFGR
jgi:hypothetical protein